ncbi:rRNA pseudouridine synthase [Rossellomorea marisflavi]|uniref:Pseudouridine synthase n=1 Tax=Rossellomorea marisflavi TaxID=189381 RepID=A0A5D4S248_9BACI|nr:pseudouridine synthase [Rossellomorea marisflavi]KQU59738.1 pseudouridine synthase [Bacillus sp. Leaf406]VXB37617.1 23S rRNA pseudouridine 2633 (=2605 standard) pseudouridine synthase [Bacillus sp. 349Y]MDR4936449.1 pseudouridine synthase [Rossellomorea marisflavi]MDW4527207.1 pseudouridine synthase [Rossellomorea marisflavi]TYS56641.1 rRNA pseudouridine synthase [Rossellomorea marisflavi]
MERLQKVIAHSGVASRRKAEQLIIEGKVKVNGKVVKELGTKVAASDRVDVSGVQIERENKVYYMLYKPRSVISAVTDDKNREVVTDFFPEIDERIYPIGRLDYETSGLLLLTNDGEFANLLMHPSNEIEKTYVARVKGIPSKFKLKELEKGVKLEDGRTAPAKVKMLSMDKKQGKSIIEITIHEGRNRQVRRMFEHIGYPVQKLKRERYGSLTLQGLTAGEGRELTPHEVKQLRTLAESAANK